MEETKSLKCPYADMPIPEGRNPIREHAMCYSTQGLLTMDSMTEKHKEQGITYWTNLKFNTILNLAADRHITATANNISLINNPESLGLWEDGTFKSEAFFELCQNFSIDDHGVQIFTKSNILKYRNKFRKDVQSTVATKTYGLPVSWKQITLASIDELFEHYSDHWYQNGCFYEKAITVATFEQFYTQPIVCRQRQINGEFRIPKP